MDLCLEAVQDRIGIGEVRTRGAIPLPGQGPATGLLADVIGGRADDQDPGSGRQGQDAILIDAGLSCRETVKRMSRLQLQVEQVRALFISHEHTDHITGAAQLSRQYGIPVYSMPGTLKCAGMTIEPERLHTIRANEQVVIGGMSVMPFVKHHDAADPVSFVVEYDGIKAGVFTDIGKVCETVIHYFR